MNLYQQLCTGSSLTLKQRLICQLWGQNSHRPPLTVNEDQQLPKARALLDGIKSNVQHEVPLYFDDDAINLNKRLSLKTTPLPLQSSTAIKQPSRPFRELTQKLLRAAPIQWSNKLPTFGKLTSSPKHLMSQDLLQLESSIKHDVFQKAHLPLSQFSPSPFKNPRQIHPITFPPFYQTYKPPYLMTEQMQIMKPPLFSASDLSIRYRIPTQSARLQAGQADKGQRFSFNTWTPIAGPKLRTTQTSQSDKAISKAVKNHKLEDKLKSLSVEKTFLNLDKYYVNKVEETVTATPISSATVLSTSSESPEPIVSATGLITVNEVPNTTLAPTKLSKMKTFIESLKVKDDFGGRNLHVTESAMLYDINKPSTDFLFRFHQKIPADSIKKNTSSSSVKMTSSDKVVLPKSIDNFNNFRNSRPSIGDNQPQQSEIVNAMTVTSLGGSVTAHISHETTTTSCPTFPTVTESNFTCDNRISGFYADTELGCQVMNFNNLMT